MQARDGFRAACVGFGKQDWLHGHGASTGRSLRSELRGIAGRAPISLASVRKAESCRGPYRYGTIAA
jgi:hypothetical protein